MKLLRKRFLSVTPINFHFRFEDTKNFPAVYQDPKQLIGVNERVQQAIHLLQESNLFSTRKGGIIKNPIVFTGMRFGGKTTLMRLLLERLKKEGFLCVPATFRNFSPRDGERQKLSILRILGETLSNFDPAKHGYEDLEQSLKDFLDKNITSNQRFVLLIDDLHEIGALSREGIQLLENLILSKPNRFLVYSTADPVSSKRFTFTQNQRFFIHLPLSTNLTLLRNMSKECYNLTISDILINGPIPSLIFMKASNQNILFDAAPLATKQKSLKNISRQFLEEILTSKEVFRMTDPFALYCSRFSYNWNGKKKWPMSHIPTLLATFSLGKESIVKRLFFSVNSLIPLHSDRFNPVKIWRECFHFSILLHLLYAELSDSEHPFMKDLKVKHSSFVFLEAKTETLEDAKDNISKVMKKHRVSSLVLFLPTFGRFPYFDGFLAAKFEDGRVRVHAYQVALKGKSPRIRKGAFPEWVTKAYLIRGFAPKSVHNSGDWEYLNKEAILSVLGSSLQIVYPADWPGNEDQA